MISYYPQFSSEQLTIFQKRYENEYDVYTEYILWLRQFHSDSLPPVEELLGVTAVSCSSGSLNPGSSSSGSSHTASLPTGQTWGQLRQNVICYYFKITSITSCLQQVIFGSSSTTPPPAISGTCVSCDSRSTGGSR